jgi:hypothetical protein
MKKLLLALLMTMCCSWAVAQQTQKTLKKIRIDHFFSCPLDQLMDSLAVDYHLNIVFERDSLHRYDIVAHFFDEPLKKVLDEVCGKNGLHYWIENDGAIYILENTDDLARLKKLRQLNTGMAGAITAAAIEPPRAPPAHFLFSISGKVVDQNTGESLPSATVKIRNTSLSTITRDDGSFTIFNIPSDTCLVEVSYSGYQYDYFRLDADKITKPLVLGLYPALNALNEVTILGTKSGVMNTDTKKVGVLQLTPAELDKLPSLGEKDILRAFQLMPGVSGTNESSSGAYVRGGTPDQNLVLFDGFTVYQVDHLYGFFSAFNSNAVKDVQLYKGGFSSMFGGRLSSVTQINGKDGNKNETNFGVDLSLLSVNGYFETPVNKESTLLVAFRRSYQGPLYDKIFGQFNTATVTSGGFGGGGRPGGGPPGGGGGFGESTTPASHFYDVDARYSYHLNASNLLVFSFYAGSDKTDNGRALQLPFNDGSNINITDLTQYGNLAGSIKWFRQWSKAIHTNTYVTYSSYFNDRTRATGGTRADSAGNLQSFYSGTTENNDLKDIGVKSESEWQFNNHYKLLFGAFGNYQQINYTYVQNDTLSLISQHTHAFTGGAYQELEIDPTNHFHLQPGIRETWYQPTGKLYIEPRLSASYVLNGGFTLKAATGQFYQYINEVTREDIVNGNRNFWVLANNNNIPVGMARHYMGGVSYENDQFLIDVEGYYKTLSDLTQYTVTQSFEPGSAGNTVQQNFYNGKGFARGLEVLLQKKLGRYTGWLSYTLADAENKFAIYGNTYYPADQDIRHEFKSINMYHYQRWNFAAVFIFSTGHPYTAPQSTYTINSADGIATTYYNVSAKNALRYPDYHRLDLSATYDLLKISGGKVGSIGLSLFNVYDHTNLWYREYQLQNNQVITTNVNYLGFTPNLTFTLKWK